MSDATILFLAANPVTTGRLALDEEARFIETCIQHRACRVTLTLRTRWAARPRDLLAALNEDRPAVVHFSGHGSGSGGLFLHDDDGRPAIVTDKALRGLFKALKDDIRVVVLNACYSEHQARVIGEVIDCVVGMSQSIGDRSARVFAAAFYQALGHGRDVQNAFDQGQVAIDLEGLGQEDVPRLLVRTGVRASNVFLTAAPTDGASANGSQAATTDMVPRRCVITLRASVQDIDTELLADLTELLRQCSGDVTLTIETVEEGSVRLRIVTTGPGQARLLQAYRDGDLMELAGFAVLSIEGDARKPGESTAGFVVLSIEGDAGKPRESTASRRDEPPQRPFSGWALSPEFGGTERFELIARLSDVVYEVYDQQRARKVALKTIRSQNAAALYQFKSEFRRLIHVNHPNVVAALDLTATDDGRLWFFTMELIRGADFITWVRDEKDPDSSPPFLGHVGDSDSVPADVGSVRSGWAMEPVPLPPPSYPRLHQGFRQLVAGVDALHRAGLLHRDIKPSNVLVQPSGRVVLVDFGLAADIDSQRGLVATEMITDTIHYMSPEQGSSGSVGPASDWYSVGTVLYQALTGIVPFSGRSIQVLIEKLQKEPAAPRELVPETPLALSELCEDLLRRDPAARPDGPEILRRLRRRSS